MKEEDLKSLRDERLVQIAEAALTLFVRKGYHATKVSEIAAAAQVSHGLFYHYYENKEKLLIELARSVLIESYSFLLKYKELEGNPVEVLKTMTQFVLTHSSGYHFAFSLQLHTSDTLPEISELLQSYGVSRHIDALVPLFAEGQQQGLFVSSDTRELAACYVSIMQGFMLQSLQNPDFRFPSADFIIRGLLP